MSQASLTAKNSSNNEILEALRQQKAKESRESFKSFVKYTMPNYEFGWFNELICLELEKFLRDVEAGLMPRLMLFAPPRSGKSELASRRFPTYAFGKHPEWNIISTSYSSDLANRMSRDCQRIIDSPEYDEVFPSVNLNNSNLKRFQQSAIRTAELWELIDEQGKLHGGAYRAAGVNGGITGQGMNIGIIDDPAKDYKTASSAAYQESVIDWYETTFYTRLDPKKNGIIIILTRWHQLDLAGQLLKKAEEGGEPFRVVSFPMEAEAKEVHEIDGRTFNLREPGEILFPERMPENFVEKCKGLGSLTWNALYQQRPTGKGGTAIKSEWFNYYKVLPPLEWRAIFVDTAQKKGEENDFTVMECWGLGEDNRLYLIDVLRKKLEAHELEKAAPAFWKKHVALNKVKGMGKLRYMGVEDKSSGTGLIQTIKRKALCPIRPIPRSDSKPSRLMDVQGHIESGYIYLPDASVDHLFPDGSQQTDCSWVNDFTEECESFTMEMTHAHDDFIDPMMDAISQMFGITQKRGFFD